MSGVQLGLCLDGTLPIREAAQAARQAEAAGFESIWVSEQVAHREAIATATAVLAATKRIRVVPMALSPFTRHPVTIAAAVATLAEWAPGRVDVAIGPGSPRGLTGVGVRVEAAASRLEEAGRALRSWFVGGSPDGATALRFRPPGSVRLYLTATRPRMLRVGAAFDGVVLTGGLSATAVAWSREQVGAPVEIVAIVAYARPGRGRNADAVLREAVVELMGSPHHQVVLRATEPDLPLDAILAEMVAAGAARAGRLLSEGVVATHGIREGEAIGPRLAAYGAAGAGTVVLWPIGEVANWRWLARLG